MGQILCCKTNQRSHERREGKDIFFWGGWQMKLRHKRLSPSMAAQLVGGRARSFLLPAICHPSPYLLSTYYALLCAEFL